jgi:DNA-binding LacI/PurR family transcriptional regulator
MPVTIEDVAQRAGVSTATVSRALRGLPHVSEETRARVAGIALDLGYVASRSASNLATGRTRTVGVVTPHIAKWFFSNAIQALERELSSCGYDVLLIVLPPTRGSGMGPGAGVGRPPFDAEGLRQRVDAVAVLTVPLTGSELDALRRLRLPIVFVGGSVSGVMSVRIDDLAVGRLATEHLLSLGHRRIAHIGGDPMEPLNFNAPVDRRAGWSSALRATGIEPDAELDVPGYFTVEGGQAAMRQLLALEEPPTAVFAGSDEMAFGALAALRETGRSAPRDVSVIGVDDHELAAATGLTTVRQPVVDQGRTAARLLLEALSPTTGASHVSEHVLLPVQLVERCSTATIADRSFVSQS